MNITEVRLRNLGELMKRFQQKEAAQGLPERGSLARFAESVGLSPAYLSHINNKRKSMGHATARQLESALKLPDDWMDVDHLSGAVHMDAAAREFGALAMKLYMDDPEAVRAVLMRYMTENYVPESKSAPKKAAK